MARRYKTKKALRSEIPAKATETDLITQWVPAWFNRDWLWGLILVLAVILVYSPVWWAGFIWDDDFDLTANPVIVGPLGLKDIWTTSASQFYPLVLTTFWLEHALWGSSATTVSSRECFIARRVRRFALACPAQFARSGCLVGSCTLGPSSGGSGIGSVDCRNEEHGVGIVLPVLDPFFCKMVED